MVMNLDDPKVHGALFGISWAGILTSATAWAQSGLSVAAAAIALVAGVFHMLIQMERWRRLRGKRKLDE